MMSLKKSKEAINRINKKAPSSLKRWSWRKSNQEKNLTRISKVSSQQQILKLAPMCSIMRMMIQIMSNFNRYNSLIISLVKLQTWLWSSLKNLIRCRIMSQKIPIILKFLKEILILMKILKSFKSSINSDNEKPLILKFKVLMTNQKKKNTIILKEENFCLGLNLREWKFQSGRL